VAKTQTGEMFVSSRRCLRLGRTLRLRLYISGELLLSELRRVVVSARHLCCFAALLYQRNTNHLSYSTELNMNVEVSTL